MTKKESAKILNFITLGGGLMLGHGYLSHYSDQCHCWFNLFYDGQLICKYDYMSSSDKKSV